MTNDIERASSRRRVWETILYARSVYITGTREQSKYGTTGWTQSLDVPMLMTGSRLREPVPTDRSLFPDSDPPAKVRIYCEPEILPFLCGPMASYISGAELLRFLPANKPSAALARSYLMHSLTRWRVRSGISVSELPPVSMGEIFQTFPPPGGAYDSLPALVDHPKNSKRVLSLHRDALRKLREIGAIEEHPDADEWKLQRRLDALGKDSSARLLWTRPFPSLQPSVSLAIRIETSRKGRVQEMLPPVAIEAKRKRGRPRKAPAAAA
jgi:hypothetical protein